jgi:hypothetical protein
VIRRSIVAAILFGLAFAAGCKHKCGHHHFHHRDAKPCCPPGSAPAVGNPYLLPPAGVPTTPAPVPGPAVGVPPVGPMDLRNYSPPAKPEVLLPDPIPGTGSSRRALPGFLGRPVNPAAEPQVAPRGSDAPTGLSGYTRVKQGLATGRKPSLDGFDALKQAGVRTVLYLHGAGADWSAAKEIADKRGLTFLAIETTPEKLSTAIEQFNATVADSARQPIYVFDDDGVRTGIVWYLHFRTADSLNDDAARVRARPLGLSDEGEEARAFAVAAQRYLESR